MRGLLLTLTAAAAVTAHASFEMALLAVSGSNSILRVDPENRVVLGAFGASRLIEPRAVAVNQSRNEAIILNSYGGTGSRITVMNYNTGAFVREWAVTASSSAYDIEVAPDGSIYVPSATGVDRFNATGTLLGSYVTTGGAIRAVGFSQFYQEVYAFNPLGGNFFIINAADYRAYNPFGTGAMNGPGFNTGNGNNYGGSGQNFVRFSPASIGFSSVSVTVVNSITSTAAGHGNTIYAAGFGTAGQSSIVTMDTSMSRLSDAWNIPGGGNGIYSIATVIAPEPGSLGILAVGALFMMRRRKV